MYYPSDEEMDERIAAIERNESTPSGRAWRFIARFVTRTLRIAAGAITAIIGLVAGANSLEILGRPFVAQSFLGLVGGLALGVIALWALYFALGVAFGAKPSAEEDRQRRIKSARSTLQEARRQHEFHEATRLREERHRQWLYTAGRFVGRLFSRR